MAGGLKIWVKELKGLHYLFSGETMVLNRGGFTAELICVFISQNYADNFLPFFVYFFICLFVNYIFMKIWHIPKIDLSIPYLRKYLQKYPISL